MDFESTFTFLLSIACTLACCLLITRLCRSADPYDYKYRGNHIWLAGSSNAGSLFSLSLFIWAMSYTVLNIGTVVAIPWALSVILGFILLSLAVWFSPVLEKFKMEEMAQKRGKTVAHFISFAFNDSDQVTYRYCTGLVVFYCCVFIAVEFKLFLYFLQQTASINTYLAIPIAVFVILMVITYILRGGFKGILYTDLAQFIFVLIFLILAIDGTWTENRIPNASTGFLNLFTDFKAGFKSEYNTPIYFIAIMAWSLPWFICSPDLWMRTVATPLAEAGKSKLAFRKTATYTLLISAFILCITALLQFIFVSRAETDILKFVTAQQLEGQPEASHAFPLFLAHLIQTAPQNQILIFFLTIVITCFSLTTIDTLAFTLIHESDEKPNEPNRNTRLAQLSSTSPISIPTLLFISIILLVASKLISMRFMEMLSIYTIGLMGIIAPLFLIGCLKPSSLKLLRGLKTPHFSRCYLRLTLLLYVLLFFASYWSAPQGGSYFTETHPFYNNDHFKFYILNVILILTLVGSTLLISFLYSYFKTSLTPKTKGQLDNKL